MDAFLRWTPLYGGHLYGGHLSKMVTSLRWRSLVDISLWRTNFLGGHLSKVDTSLWWTSLCGGQTSKVDHSLRWMPL